MLLWQKSAHLPSLLVFDVDGDELGQEKGNNFYKFLREHQNKRV